jgi:hypothetical protein
VSIDYGEVERQFLATLRDDTGRTLEDWMGAIAAEGLSHRNDIIDWLRRQGFMFSKASWLERIHNNGGRPIYQGGAGPRPRAPSRPRLPRPAPPDSAQPDSTQPDSAPQPAAQASLPPVAPPAPASPERPATPDTAAALDALIARAKAFRPLAAYLIAEIRKAVPGVAVTPHEGYAVFAAGSEFAVLAVSPKELRLGLAAQETLAAPWEASKLGLRAAPATTHMVVLTDARQVTPALIAAVARAAQARPEA